MHLYADLLRLDLQVYLIGLAEEQSAAGRASKYDSYALDKMSIRVSPKVFGARIRCGQLLITCCI